MNTKKTGNLAILVAFCLIATILTCTVAIAAGNIQLSPDASPDNGNADTTPPQVNGDPDENGNDNENSEEEEDQKNPIPEFIHSITGLGISSDESIIRPYCFITASDSPLYGLSSSYMTIEMPIEGGKTRLLMFTDDPKSLGKIGSIAPTRDYITVIGNAFGANVLCYGDDGLGTSQVKADILDFKKNLGYHYTEYNEFAYSNGDLITAFVKNNGATTVRQSKTVTPYTFVDYFGEPIKGIGGDFISVNYGNGNTTELTYNKADATYLLSKNGVIYKDALNDKRAEYTNVFLLFADSATYENENSTTTVIETSASGKGIYATGGGHTEFTWQMDAEGNLEFRGADGEKLAVNRGASYICYVKSSQVSSVTIS